MSKRKIARAIDEVTARQANARPEICPLCQRPIPSGAKASKHHLTPRLKGGTHKGTVLLHQICHSAIHARFSETELAKRLNDIAALRNDPQMADFLDWVKDKPPHFHTRTRKRRDRKGKQRTV